MPSAWLGAARSSDKFPFPCPPAFLYTHGNADMEILMYILKVDRKFMCCLEMCGTEINHRGEKGRHVCRSLAALVCLGLHNRVRHSSCPTA